MKTPIIERLKELFNYCEWIEECVFDEKEQAFVMLTSDNVGFALQYMQEEDFTMQEIEDFLKNHSKEDFKNLTRDLFAKNPVLGYMLFTILKLNELNILDMETCLDICKQMTEHEEEILKISQRFHELHK